MSNKNPLVSYIINDPESAFDSPHLSYKSIEIESIIDRFNLASYRPIHSCVKDLLYATSDFRRSTVPKGLFQELRSTTKTDDELKKIFVDMNAVFERTIHFKDQLNLSKQDEKILDTALDYCKKSIKERMSSLNPNDRLIPFWNASELKKRMEG